MKTNVDKWAMPKVKTQMNHVPPEVDEPDWGRGAFVIAINFHVRPSPFAGAGLAQVTVTGRAISQRQSIPNEYAIALRFRISSSASVLSLKTDPFPIGQSPRPIKPHIFTLGMLFHLIGQGGEEGAEFRFRITVDSIHLRVSRTTAH